MHTPKMRMLDAMESQIKKHALPGRKVVKKKRKILLSGLMVGPIKPEAWEPPDPILLGFRKNEKTMS